MHLLSIFRHVSWLNGSLLKNTFHCREMCVACFMAWDKNGDVDLRAHRMCVSARGRVIILSVPLISLQNMDEVRKFGSGWSKWMPGAAQASRSKSRRGISGERNRSPPLRFTLRLVHHKRSDAAPIHMRERSRCAWPPGVEICRPRAVLLSARCQELGRLFSCSAAAI